MHSQWRRGRAARHRSAKPSTPVRIRAMPQKPSKKLGGFFFIIYYFKIIQMKKILLFLSLVTSGIVSTTKAQNTITATNDIIATSAGTITFSILDNDTLNGNSATTNNVTITPVTTPNGFSYTNKGEIIIDSNIPSGTYLSTYSICENGIIPANCSTATVIINIHNPINAVNDTLNISNVTLPSPSITQNDTLNGSPVIVDINSNIYLTVVAAPNGITMHPYGILTFDPNIQDGMYSLTYQICESGAIPVNCDLATVSIFINKSLANPSFKNAETLSLYPNPVQDVLTIENLTDSADYTLYNAIGVEVKSGSVTEKNNKINTESLEKGMYLIQIGNTKLKIIKA